MADSVAASSLHEYCQGLCRSSEDGMDNLDDARTLPYMMQRVQECSTADFAVLFNDDAAFAGFNLSAECYKQILSWREETPATARWINIWYPSQHLDLLDHIGKHYDFSPRLLALICSESIPHTTTSSLQDQARPSLHKSWFSHHTRSIDEESSAHSELVASITSSTDQNIYRLASEIWHYSTIDFGRNYVCIGYNSLYGMSPLQGDLTDHLPYCTRAWTWLILGSDNTVISINEDLFPQAHQRYTSRQLQALSDVRRNIVSVFRSLSLVDSDPLETRNPMRLLPIRARLGSTRLEDIHHESNAPGLLFYYLFENWQNSFTLITRKESKYGMELEKLRREMLIKPRLAHIDRLHTIAQELGILKRHYESYNRIIDRLLEPRPPTLASLQNSRLADDAVSEPLLAKESSLGVSISTAVRMRFKRLQDLIDLYALSEVDDYLAQKASLVSLNFNLLTLKESLDVEKLTRITLFLTKATFLFLPVSLMQGYFSLGLLGTEYTVPEFWIACTVTICISALALVAFGLFSNGAEWSVFGMSWSDRLKRGTHTGGMKSMSAIQF